MSKARELGTYAGKILQVKSTIKTDTFTTTSGSVTDITGLSVAITPASTSNKILVIARVNIGLNRTAPYLYPLFLYRDSTSIGPHDAASNRTRAHSGGQWPCAATDPTVDYVLEFLDSVGAIDTDVSLPDMGKDFSWACDMYNIAGTYDELVEAI